MTTITSDLTGDNITIDGVPFTDFVRALDHLKAAGAAHRDAHRALTDARYKGSATLGRPAAS